MPCSNENIKPLDISKHKEHSAKLLSTLIGLYHELEKGNSSFCYRGPFLERFTNTIIDISNGALSSHQMLPTMNRKISFLLVECFQNVLRHGESMHNELPIAEDDGIFGFRKINGQFIINSINFLQDQESQPLIKLVETVNALGTTELKEMYLQQLNSKEISEKGGAGLGLIELARKSGQPLQYELESLGKGISSFHQQVSFTTNEANQKAFNFISSTKQIYRKFVDENIFLFYQGDFSQKSILPMLDIVEHNVSSVSDLNNAGRKTGHVLVELLQNVSKHGGMENGNREGIFLIGQKNNKIFLQVANPVDIAEKSFIEEKIKYLVSLNKEELIALHKKALKASIKFESKHKSGLGLIEVARACESPLYYMFEPLGDNKFLFALHANI